MPRNIMIMVSMFAMFPVTRVAPCADKVQLKSFSVVQAAGREVTVKGAIKNLCETPQSFAWRITDGNTTVGSGTTATVQGGSIFSVGKTWITTSGFHSFSIEIDPQNLLGELAQLRVNNRPANPVTITVD
jgi:hypothetical protein